MELRKYENIGEQVLFDTLPNGLAIYVIPKKGFFKKVAFFGVNYGGSDRRFKLKGEWHDTPAGVAHFLEHKMFDKKDGNALAALSANGASPNAFTSSGITAYHFECTENFEANLRILLRFVSEPYFTDESVSKEQGIIAQEIRMTEDNPQHKVFQNLFRSLYAYNPIRDSIAGTVDSIAQITAQTLYYCHEAFYNPSNMVLCVAGDVDPQIVGSVAEEILPKAKSEVAVRDYGAKEQQFPASAKTEEAMEVAVPLFMAGTKLGGGLRGKDRQRNELLGDFAMNLLLGKSTPLYARLYAEGLINSSFFGGTTFFPDGAAAIVGGESRNPDAVCEAVMEEAAKIASKGPDKALYQRLKKAALGEEIRALNSLYLICNRQMTGHFEDYDPMDNIKIMEEITAGDIVEFIGSSLSPEKLALSVIRPSKGGK